MRAGQLAEAAGLSAPAMSRHLTNSLPGSDEASGWIEFHVGNCSLMVFGLSEGDASGAPVVATHVPWVFVDDLDAHYEHAVSRGPAIVEDIHQHGYRAYVARDPDGYTWTIAQARPGMR
jgi:uncharacterized glyoxalase superfamily protein PhnB